MTKKADQVNADKPAEGAAETTENTSAEQTLEELAGGEDPEPEEGDDPEGDMNEAEALDEEPVEETPVPAETAAPLMNHGTHNAAVNGLQTSPGYDPSKL